MYHLDICCNLPRFASQATALSMSSWYLEILTLFPKSFKRKHWYVLQTGKVRLGGIKGKKNNQN